MVVLNEGKLSATEKRDGEGKNSVSELQGKKSMLMQTVSVKPDRQSGEDRIRGNYEAL